jgi:hypothetical protein
MVFEIGAASADWQDFQVRKLGIAVQKLMAQSFNGNQRQLRDQAAKTIAEAFDLRLSALQAEQLQAFENLALVFALVADVEDWSKAEKQLAKQIIEAKLGADEAVYLRLLQKLTRLRQALLAIGS